MKKIKLAMFMAMILLFVPVVALGQMVDTYGDRNDNVYEVTDGTNLSANITQGDPTSDPPVKANDNLVRIKQVSGDSNSASITQYRDWNQAYQYQYYGEGNTAVIEQDGTGSSTSKNKATQTQGVDNELADASTGNFASIYQSGQSNEAEQTQVGTNLNSSLLLLDPEPGWGIYQLGTNNWAKQNQTGDNNVAQIEQRNNWGYAEQNQYYGNNNTARIYQYGTGSSTSKNKATQTQGVDNELADASTGNFASIRQWGQSNIAEQTQVGTNLNSSLLPVNGWGIYQFGTNNRATQNQTGSDHEARITQYNNWGDATQNQFYGSENTARIYQNGTGSSLGSANTAIQTQGENDPLAEASTGNFASIYQYGNTNWAEQTQIGNSNNEVLLPAGYGIYQYGVNNWAKQTQTGDSNEAQIYQNGDNNRATQTQDGNNHIARVQQIGNNNTITQDQSGPIARFSDVIQTGDFNNMTVIQH